ncbi:MAG: hypothetical protein V3U76_11760 [Granulosicoccus sp.]
MQAARFADLSKAIFYLVASVSLIVLVLVFVFVWQPIWTTGFKDFHTISDAIAELDDTARPASEVAPLLLDEIRTMNVSLGNIRDSMVVMDDMKVSMNDMSASIQSLQEINPNMLMLNDSVSNMGQVLSNQMSAMNSGVDRMGNKLSPMGMMPFNW